MTKKIVFIIFFILCAGYSANSQAMEFDMMDNVDIHGFISQGYLKSTDNNFFANTKDGTSQFNEVGVNFSTDVTDKLRLGVQFFSRDMGTIGNNEVILDWAFADYRWQDWLGLRAGNMKMTHGLYNEIRDTDLLRTNIFLPQSVYNESWREASTLIQGMGIYGEVPMGVAGSLSYEGQYGTLSIAADKGAARLAEDQWPLANVDISPLLAAADPDVLTAALGSMGANLTAGYVAEGYTYNPSAEVDSVVENLVMDDIAVTQEQIAALTSQTNIDLISVETNDIDVDQAYTGRIHWSTPIDGLVLGGSTFGYYFEAEMASYLSSGAMQTIAAYQGVNGILTDYAADGSVDNGPDWVEQFEKADSLGGFGDYGIKFPMYPTIFIVDAKAYTGSIEYTWQSLVLSAEYMRIDYQIKFNNELFKDPVIRDLLENASDYTTMDSAGNMIVPDFSSLGWYVGGAYRFTYWFELGLYYSEYYPDEDDRDGRIRVEEKKLDNEYFRGWLKDTCMTLRFDINENWVAKVEGHLMDGAAILLKADNPVPSNGSDRFEEDWMLFAGKLTYSF